MGARRGPATSLKALLALYTRGEDVMSLPCKCSSKIMLASLRGPKLQVCLPPQIIYSMAGDLISLVCLFSY